jgi:hypothetical protein
VKVPKVKTLKGKFFCETNLKWVWTQLLEKNWHTPKLFDKLKRESEVKTTEEQRVGACSLAHSILKGRRACWSSRMGLGRMTST